MIDYVIKMFSHDHDIDLYSSMEKIGTKKFICTQFESPLSNFNLDTLILLKNRRIALLKDLRDNFVLFDAFNGQYYGYHYSEDLCQADNRWIGENRIVCIFIGINNDGLCSYEFYTIKGVLNSQKKKKLKSKINALLRKEDQEGFERELKKLYKQRIIMLGVCGC